MEAKDQAPVTAPEGLTAAVVTVSDSCARGDRADLSGPAVGELLRKRNFSLIGTEVVPDDQAAIQTAIGYWVQEAQLVVTTGGTGIAERDANDSSKELLNACAPKAPGRLRSPR
jgi:molybdenum cofactor synthesis domain-containing protein